MTETRNDDVVEVWFDGASKGNPGIAGAGVVIRHAGQVRTISEPLGTRSNNEAEWRAAYLGLVNAAKTRAKRLVIRGDSQLVIKQLSGEYQVKAPGLRQIHAAACTFLEGFSAGVDLQWIPRHENGAADAAANQGVKMNRKSADA